MVSDAGGNGVEDSTPTFGVEVRDGGTISFKSLGWLDPGTAPSGASTRLADLPASVASCSRSPFKLKPSTLPELGASGLVDLASSRSGTGSLAASSSFDLGEIGRRGGFVWRVVITDTSGCMGASFDISLSAAGETGSIGLA